MKKLWWSSQALMVGSLVFLWNGCVSPAPAPAEVVVSSPPPAAPVEVMPATPGPEYVWVEGYWGWHGRWVWEPGHWAVRPHARAAWEPGHWVHGRRGWVWREGHWR